MEGVWLAPAPRPPRRTARQRAADLARGITSLVGLLLLLVGLPAGLAYGVGWPLPHSWDAVYTWLNGPTRVTPRGLVAAGACVLWLLWLAITIAVVIEVVAAVRRVRVPRLVLATPFQGLAAGLVGTAVIALTGTTARAASPPQPASSTLPTNPPQLSSASDSPAPGSAQTGRGRVTLVAAGRRYTATVHHGDTLSAIARDWLGDPDRWPEIYRLNQGRHFPYVGGSLTDPNLIYPGWVLDLPDDARPPSGGPVAGPAPPTPQGVDQDHLASPSAEAPVPPGTAAPPAPIVPSPTPPSSDTATPRAPAGEPRPAEDRRPDRGIELPDHGWVAAPVAAAVTAAAALVWIQRRRRYRPHVPTGTHSRERDLAPLPNTIAVLHRARAAPPVDDHGNDPLDEIPDDVPAEAMEAMTVTHTAIGVHAGQPLRLTDLPPRGTGLVGPGAEDAGRGVIAAVLSSGGPWAGNAEASLITTAADLHRLLGANDTARYWLDRLQVTPDLNSALDQMERELLYRARIASEQHDLDDELAAEPADALPPLVLLTQAPNEPAATRLDAILTIGARLHLTGILLGAWAAGTTWHVAADGTTQADEQPTGTHGPRLNVLDHIAVNDILGTLQQARPIDRAPAEPAIATPIQSSVPAPAGRPAEAAPTQRTPADLVPTPPAAAYRLRLAVLGRPSVQLLGSDRTEELHIRRTDGIQILVHLAVDPDGATSDQLMATLWPEIRPRYARGRFHTTISELRHNLAAALDTNIILNTGGRYHLDPQQVEVDLWHVYAAIERAASAVDPDTHSGALHDIIQLHTAPIAAGEDWLWVLPYREATRRRVLDAYTELANEEADPRAALNLIQQAIDLDPYNEDLYQRAMRLHAALNHPDGVHRALRAITERLAQLDNDVSAQTRRLAADLITKLDARRRS